MSNLEKAILGALGGLSAVLVKFLGQDYANVVAHAAYLTADQWLAYKIGYGLLTPILMFLGGFVAWISDEQKRMKVVALAIAAPAMITTWSGGQKLDADFQKESRREFFTNAYAESGDPGHEGIKSETPDIITEKNAWQQIQEGVGVFFGYGKEPKKYWVIVGSYQERKAAQQFADKINAEDRTLNAWVGVKVPPNDYYPVIVGGYSYLSHAKELRRKALASNTIKEAYLSSGAQRF